jgi:hypothetical protein
MRVDELRTELEEAAGRQPVPDVDAGRRAVRRLVRRRRLARGAVLGVLALVLVGVGVGLTTGGDTAQELQVVDVPREDPAPSVAPTETTVPAGAPQVAPTVDALHALRNRAADTPWWHKVNWVAPRTLDDVVLRAEGVAVARIDGARSSGAIPDPAFGRIEPPVGHWDVQRVDVIVDVAVLDVGSRTVRLPVDTGVDTSMEEATALAEEIAALTPAPAGAVLTLDEGGGATFVALAADDGTLVAFHESLDPVVAGYDLDGLVAALRARID